MCYNSSTWGRLVSTIMLVLRLQVGGTRYEQTKNNWKQI